MKAVVLAGGLGTRLSPLTESLPKPMVPVGNRPVMEYVLRLLARHGFTEVVTNPCHLGHTISDYFGEGEKFGVSLKYAPEEELIGTAGTVKQMARAGWIGSGTFLVIGGDDLTDMDLSELLRRHRQAGATATLGLTRVADPTHYGIVVTDETGRIVSFQEKPEPEEAASDVANTGIYLLEPEVLEYIPEGEFPDFSLNIFPQLLKAGVPFFGFEMSGYWRDVGTLDDYLLANIDVAVGRGPLACLDSQQGERALPALSQGAAVIAEGAIVDPRCQIGDEACIGEGCVIGSRARIAAGCQLETTVVWPQAELSPGTDLADAIVTPEHVVRPSLPAQQ